MESLSSFNYSLSLIFIGVVVLLYAVYGALYRLYLCPIAKFPGPKLAALTFWYELWYDVVRNGRYTWKIEEMHKRYGIRTSLPIGRVLRN